MSVCYSMMCFDCKKSVWCGQSSRTFYSGEPHTMEALKEFLFDHMKHNLKYDAPEFYEDFDEDGWEEIDSDKYKTAPPAPEAEEGEV